VKKKDIIVTRGSRWNLSLQHLDKVYGTV